MYNSLAFAYYTFLIKAKGRYNLEGAQNMKNWIVKKKPQKPVHLKEYQICDNQ